jgi:hypothetical protein
MYMKKILFIILFILLLHILNNKINENFSNNFLKNKKIAQILFNDDILELKYDFKKYRDNCKKNYKLYFINKNNELNIRYKNLQDIINIFNKHKVNYWLQGKTLLGMYQYGKLLENDSDEDIGIDKKDLLIVCKKIVPDLLNIGFEIIRVTKNNSMITFMRNYRYLDICIFRKNKDKYYYENKSFPYSYYLKFTKININNFNYNIPEKSREICKYSYNK